MRCHGKSRPKVRRAMAQAAVAAVGTPGPRDRSPAEPATTRPALATPVGAWVASRTGPSVRFASRSRAAFGGLISREHRAILAAPRVGADPSGGVRGSAFPHARSGPASREDNESKMAESALTRKEVAERCALHGRGRRVAGRRPAGSRGSPADRAERHCCAQFSRSYPLFRNSLSHIWMKSGVYQ